MKILSIIAVLPLMATACVQWDLGAGKVFYVGSAYNTLQITDSGNHVWLYELKNINIKPLACMSKGLNTSLQIDGVPEFSQDEVSRLCNIPDFCLQKLSGTDDNVEDIGTDEQTGI